MQLCLPQALPRCVYCCQRLGQRAEPCLWLPHLPICLGEHEQKTRSVPFPSRSLHSGQPLVELSNPLLPLSLHGECPPSHEHSQRQVLCKPVLSRERHACLCPFLGGVPF